MSQEKVPGGDRILYSKVQEVCFNQRDYTTFIFFDGIGTKGNPTSRSATETVVWVGKSTPGWTRFGHPLPLRRLWVTRFLGRTSGKGLETLAF